MLKCNNFALSYVCRGGVVIMAKFCTQCGSAWEEGSSVCTNCGNKVRSVEEEVVVNNSEPVNQNVNYNNNGSTSKNITFAFVGFILSLVNLLCCGAFSIFGLIFSIVGLVESKKQNGNGKGMAIAGIIISSIFIVLSILSVVLGIFSSMIEELS